jgi:hypothetical protein
LAEVTKQKINGDGNPHKITGGNAISGNFEDIPVFAN